jgi:hypothetical protein
MLTTTCRTSARNRGLRGLVIALAICGISSRSLAQAPSLDVYYDRLDPKTTFKYKWKGEEKTCNVGAFHWEIPPSTFSTGGLDRNFTGYCAEVLHPIEADRLYRFRAITLLEPTAYGLEATPEGIRSAERRATLIRELFGRYYRENKFANPDSTFAMQLALWELSQEPDPVDRAVTFDLFSGDFQANYPRDMAPPFVTLAQSYLESLTGNDAIYYENQDIAGRELIRLQGIPAEDGVIAQAQYALRFINGGAPSTGPFASSLSNGGGGGLLGGGGGLLGGGLGEGEGASGGGPLVTTGNTGTTTNTSVPPTTTNTRVPQGGPSGTPVPAPAGLVLGLVAVGAFASRRVYLRMLQRHV